MSHTKAGKAFTDLILETFRFNGLLLAAGDRLTSARWQVLGAIADEPRSVARIGRKMGLARQNVQRLADVLAEQGIVELNTLPIQTMSVPSSSASPRKEEGRWQSLLFVRSVGRIRWYPVCPRPASKTLWQ